MSLDRTSERETLWTRLVALTTIEAENAFRALSRGSQRDCASYYRPGEAQRSKRMDCLKFIAGERIPGIHRRLDVLKDGC